MRLLLNIILGVVSFCYVLTGLLMIVYPEALAPGFTSSMAADSSFMNYNYKIPGIFLIVNAAFYLSAMLPGANGEARNSDRALSGGVISVSGAVLGIILVERFLAYEIIMLCIGILISIMAASIKKKWIP